MDPKVKKPEKPKTDRQALLDHLWADLRHFGGSLQARVETARLIAELEGWIGQPVSEKVSPEPQSKEK